MSDIAGLFGKRIRELRIELGLSQEELALRSSISPAHLGQIERASKKPTIDTIGKIADALGVPVAVLFDLDMPLKTSEAPDGTIKKINTQLSEMSESEREDILKIIRIFRGFKVK